MWKLSHIQKSFWGCFKSFYKVFDIRIALILLVGVLVFSFFNTMMQRATRPAAPRAAKAGETLVSNEAELTKAIEELTRNKTIIMIAHRLKTVRHADQILVVAGGKITQHGTHEELMAQEGIYKNFVSERKEAVSWKIA